MLWLRGRCPIALLLHNPNSFGAPWQCHSKRSLSYGHFCGLQSCHPRRLLGPGCHDQFCMLTNSCMCLAGARTTALLGQRGDVTSEASQNTRLSVFLCQLLHIDKLHAFLVNSEIFNPATKMDVNCANHSCRVAAGLSHGRTIPISFDDYLQIALGDW